LRWRRPAPAGNSSCARIATACRSSTAGRRSPTCASPRRRRRSCARRCAAGAATARWSRASRSKALLSQFGALLTKVGFDPEEWLARAFGDGAAHRLNQGLRGLLGWGRETASTLALDTAEYLREETRDLVHRADVARFNDEVDALRDRTAGVAARLERLERR
jgi:hypothetical protein